MRKAAKETSRDCRIDCRSSGLCPTSVTMPGPLSTLLEYRWIPGASTNTPRLDLKDVRGGMMPPEMSTQAARVARPDFGGKNGTIRPAVQVTRTK